MSKKFITLTLLSLVSLPVWAAQAKLGDDNSLEGFLKNPMLLVLAFVALILLFVIYAMAKVAIMVINKRTAEENSKKGNGTTKTVATIALLFLAIQAGAQDASAEAADAVSSFVLSKEALWVGIAVIVAEAIIVAYLYNIIKKFTREPKAAAEVKESSLSAWWEKFNKSTAIENEGDIDLGHSYDGIRELDNPTPPWWKLAFLLTILFAPIYLYRYHIAKSAPLQLEELAIEIEEGEAREKEYLANSTSAVNENNIATIEGIDPAMGAAIFAKNCVACHGASGEGNAVGPNLTDPNWIHGGGIENIFKSVKYGWPEKGMKSWQDDMSSLELGQVSRYVASLAGSNPPNAKEPQGDVWNEEAAGDAEADATNVEDAAVEKDAEATETKEAAAE